MARRRSRSVNPIAFAVGIAGMVAGLYVIAGPDRPADARPAVVASARPAVIAPEPTPTARLGSLGPIELGPDCIDATDPDAIEEAVLDGRLDESAIDDPDSIEEAC